MYTYVIVILLYPTPAGVWLPVDTRGSCNSRVFQSWLESLSPKNQGEKELISTFSEVIHSIARFWGRSISPTYGTSGTCLCIPVPAYTCTCLYLYLRVPVPVCTCTYVYLYLHIPVPVYTCTYVYLCLRVPVPAYTCTCVYLYLRVPVPVPACACTCVCLCVLVPVYLTGVYLYLCQVLWPPCIVIKKLCYTDILMGHYSSF